MPRVKVEIECATVAEAAIIAGLLDAALAELYEDGDLDTELFATIEEEN